MVGVAGGEARLPYNSGGSTGLKNREELRGETVEAGVCVKVHGTAGSMGAWGTGTVKGGGRGGGWRTKNRS